MDLINGKTPSQIRQEYGWLISCHQCAENRIGKPGCEEHEKTPECRIHENVLALIDKLKEESNALLEVIRGDCEYCKVHILPFADRKDTCIHCIYDPFRGTYLKQYDRQDNWAWFGADGLKQKKKKDGLE